MIAKNILTFPPNTSIIPWINIITWIKLRAKIFAMFCIANYAYKNLQKFKTVSSIEKTTLIFFKIFLWLVELKEVKKKNCKIRHYSFKIADNDLKIWQNHLLLNLFHMVDVKFDLVSRPISHGNPAMPFVKYIIFLSFKLCYRK